MAPICNTGNLSELILVIGNNNYSASLLRPWFFMKCLEVPFTERWLRLFIDRRRRPARIRSHRADRIISIYVVADAP